MFFTCIDTSMYLVFIEIIVTGRRDSVSYRYTSLVGYTLHNTHNFAEFWNFPVSRDPVISLF